MCIYFSMWYRELKKRIKYRSSIFFLLRFLSLFLQIPATDDWLEEEYEKVKKKNTLATVIATLDLIKKREESYSQMKDRVSKLKFHLNKKIDDYYKIGKPMTEVCKSQALQTPEDAFEDTDLILDQFENIPNECSDEEELPEIEEFSDITKVGKNNIID